MTEQNRIDALLLRYEERRAQDTPLSPEELCQDCPELMPELKRQILLLESMDALLGSAERSEASAAPTPTNPAVAGPSVSWASEALRTGSRYQVLRFHAKGGLGEVHVARDEELHREVALKRLQTLHARNPHSRTRFLREAEITSRLEHPSIVPVHSMGHDADGNPFYAMRFIQGQTLQEALQQFHAAEGASRTSGQRPLLPRRLLSRFVAVCNTLAYAHSKGIVHRDIKPHNIMLGPYGETLVVDWGLAKEIGSSQDARTPTPESTAEADAPLFPPSPSPTRTGMVIGTPTYMSPEQAEGRWDLVSPASDIYSLGATLYTLLTGQPPFEGRHVGEVVEKVKRGQFLRPRDRRKDIPRALEAICLKAMSRNPEMRYATALEVAADLEHWLADEPVCAWTEPWTVRVRRWLGHHRTLVTATAATVSVATVASTVGLLLLAAAADRERSARIDAQGKAREAQEQRREAERQKQKSDANFKLARQAVDDFHTQVSESGEFKAYGLEPLRRKLLQSVVEFYQRFVEAEPEDLPLQGEQGHAYRRLGDLYRFLGQHQQSEQALHKAVSLLRQAVEARPQEISYQRGLASSYRGLGLFHSTMHHTPSAEQAYLQARAVYEQLSQVHPDEVSDQRELARTERFLGRLYFETGRKDLAEEAYRRALTLRQRLADSHPQDRACRFDLADSHEFFAFLYRGTGRNDLAKHAFEQALAIVQRLGEECPQMPEYQLHLAASHGNLATIHKETGATNLAERERQQSQAIMQRLADTHPQVPEYQQKLALSNFYLGQLFYDTSQWNLAEQAYKQSVTLRQRLADANPQVSVYQAELAASLTYLANVYKNSGRTELAQQALEQTRTVFERLVHDYPDVPLHQLQLAACQRNQAILERKAGHMKAAEQLLLRALAISQRLIDTHPDEPTYREYLGYSQQDLGILYRLMGRAGSAERAFQQACVLWQRLVDVRPEIIEYTLQLGASRLALASFLRDSRDQPQESQACYAQATGPLEALLRKDPRQAKARELLLNLYGGRAVALARLDRHADAEQELQHAEVIDQAQSRDSVRFFEGFDLRSYRSRVRALGGDHARAVAEAEEAAMRTDLAGGELEFLAFTFALAASAGQQDTQRSEAERGELGERYAARAIALLRKAQAAGYFRNPAVVARLRNAPELANLRSREDFRKLMKDLEDDTQEGSQ